MQRCSLLQLEKAIGYGSESTSFWYCTLYCTGRATFTRVSCALVSSRNYLSIRPSLPIDTDRQVRKLLFFSRAKRRKTEDTLRRSPRHALSGEQQQTRTPSHPLPRGSFSAERYFPCIHAAITNQMYPNTFTSFYPTPWSSWPTFVASVTTFPSFLPVVCHTKPADERCVALFVKW